MKNKFLSNIAQNLISSYGKALSDLIIVLPSRRSSLYLSEKISEKINQPIWLPRNYTIDDFVFEVNKLHKISNLELFFEFYKIYSEILKKPHDLEKVSRWSQMLLEDFDEIDKSLVNPKDVFNYLSDVKRIEKWYLDLDSSSHDFDNYLEFYSSLNSIYDTLIKKILDKDMAYAGLAQRLTAQNPKIVVSWLKELNKNKIIFIGLDALTLAQEKVVDYLLKNNLAEIHWDLDKYFIENKIQESGKFYRRYQKKWPSIFSSISNDFMSLKKNINIIGATKNVNQVKILANLLVKNVNKYESLKNVAVILPDENMLLPVLESIPKQISSINVTMGFQLKKHPVISLFSDILNLLTNSRLITSEGAVVSQNYLCSDIIKLINNPYYQKVSSPNKKKLEQILKKINQESYNYIPVETIKKIFPKEDNEILMEFILVKHNSKNNIAQLFKKLLNRLLHLENFNTELEIFLEECLYSLQEYLDLLISFLHDIEFKIDIKLFAKFFNQIINSIKVSFAGEPLKGLQIMGLLESRTIDFDYVFILSANENTLPPNTYSNSFIPFDVKTKFKMRTSLDFDAINSNNFFNLIKRAKESFIIYDSDFSSYSSSESSRYINQLIYEIKPIVNREVKINQTKYINKFNLDNIWNNSNVFKKDNFIISKLNDLLKVGISASSINLFNKNPKQFYYEKILNVSEPDVLISSIDPPIMGSITHRSLELLYEPFLNVPLSKSNMDSMLNKLNDTIIKSFCEQGIYNFSKGKNLLAFNAIKVVVENFIKYEKRLISSGNTIVVLHVEKNLSFNFNLNDGSNKKVKLNGNIDRIDIFNGQHRVIDYKTGVVKSNELISKNLSDIVEKPKLLQLLLYSFLYSSTGLNQNRGLVAGIINLRATNFNIQNANVYGSKLIEKNAINCFIDEMRKIILKMYDLNEDFENSELDDY